MFRKRGIESFGGNDLKMYFLEFQNPSEEFAPVRITVVYIQRRAFFS